MWNTFWKQLITVDKNLNIELYNLNHKVPHSVIRAALGHGIAEKHDTAALQKLRGRESGASAGLCWNLGRPYFQMAQNFFFPPHSHGLVIIVQTATSLDTRPNMIIFPKAIRLIQNFE